MRKGKMHLKGKFILVEDTADNIAMGIAVVYCVLCTVILVAIAISEVSTAEVFNGAILLLLIGFCLFDYITTWIIFQISKWCVIKALVKKF